ncbi:MAG TPA: glycoside hydrolase family 5 protein [Chloroflexota bacterium]|nr:glycoside hydrolase family 5 protein [Chloroflexota bacterium]
MAILRLARAARHATRLRLTSPGSRLFLIRILFTFLLIVCITTRYVLAPARWATRVSAAAPARYLHTHGTRLENAAGREVHLTGVNWFGLETCAFVPHGLWSRNWRAMMLQIRSLGFNTIRLPFSNQLLDPQSRPNAIDYKLNPDLKGLSGLQIMDTIVTEARVLGLKVILDRHRPDCGAQSPLWYTDHYSEARWIADWVRLARRYAGNDAVIGADLHNEPHGPATWGDGNRATDWRLAAERAGNAILRVNPHWLIFVQGVEAYRGTHYWWGGNLMGAASAPVRLAVPHRLVYEVHDYGPEVWLQSWFGAANFPHNLPRLWDKRWGYLQQQGLAPVFVGEFGGKEVDRGKEGSWIHTLVTYIRAHGLSYTFWCLNPNSGDTGGLLANNWTTVSAAKMALLRTDLAPLIGTPLRRPSSHATHPARAAHTRRASVTRRAEGARILRSRGTRTLPAPTTGAPVRVTVQPSSANGISTGEDDLTLILPAALYHLSVTISVHRSAPSADPDEANPQPRAAGTLSHSVTTQTALESGALVYTFTRPVVPAGRAVAAARFDFTSGRQNQHGAHRYGRDTYTVRYSATPSASPTTLAGHF